MRAEPAGQLGDALVVYPHTSPSSDRLYDGDQTVRSAIRAPCLAIMVASLWHLTVMASVSGVARGQSGSRARSLSDNTPCSSPAVLDRAVANNWSARRVRWLPSDAFVEYSPPLHGRAAQSDDKLTNGSSAPPCSVRLSQPINEVSQAAGRTFGPFQITLHLPGRTQRMTNSLTGHPSLRLRPPGRICTTNNITDRSSASPAGMTDLFQQARYASLLGSGARRRHAAVSYNNARRIYTTTDTDRSSAALPFSSTFTIGGQSSRARSSQARWTTGQDSRRAGWPSYVSAGRRTCMTSIRLTVLYPVLAGLRLAFDLTCMTKWEAIWPGQ
jgi:hypothetical protein